MNQHKMAILIRRAKISDAEGLAKLYLQFWEPHKVCDPLIELKKELSCKNQLDFARKDIKKKATNIFVAAESNKVVGFIEVLIKKNDACFKINRYGYINACVTDKDERGKGIAKMLTEHALAFLKSKGIRFVRLNVYHINQAAIAVWQKLGFKPQSMNLFKKL
ncbi:GNAT family N-acetyltransferase [Candidatus Woesearchaeota archaeon]|nr:GNAT family N-acetyltransferase [Candidatus Woesearchaeota archaeon]